MGYYWFGVSQKDELTNKWKKSSVKRPLICSRDKDGNTVFKMTDEDTKKYLAIKNPEIDFG